jgi:chromosome segregation ATPase
MLSEDQIIQLKSENAELQAQLTDLNYLIISREEELELLRAKLSALAALQSKLDSQLLENDLLQDMLSDKDAEITGANKREASMEKELLQGMEMEKDYYNLRDQLNSTKAALDDMSEQFTEAAALYREVARLSSQVAELESNLEIAEMDNGFLKDELNKFQARVGVVGG